MEIYHVQNDQNMAYQQQYMHQQALFYAPSMQTYPAEAPSQQAKPSRKRGYVQCELWKRQSLVEKVEKDGMTIKDAAKALDINYSTAKHIIKVFHKTGQVETKIMMKRNKKVSDRKIDIDCESSPSMTQPMSPQACPVIFQQPEPSYLQSFMQQ